MLLLQQVTYAHPNREVLFEGLNLSLHTNNKCALVGNNGSGKSTLLKLIAGELQPLSGTIQRIGKPYYIPQLLGQYNHLSVGAALGVDRKLAALQRILAGDTADLQFELLDDDWTIEARCKEAMAYWELSDIDLEQPVSRLSGGQKTKVFLAGIMIHQPAFVLLDEPSNHLDAASRAILYAFVQQYRGAMLVVSHDQRLLNLLDTTLELSKDGLKTYGGNYDFYTDRKAVEQAALLDEVHNKEKELRKAREKERETIERQQKLDARGKKKQEKSGVPKIMMNTLRNNAEQSTAKTKAVHGEKISGIREDLSALRAALPDLDKMRLGFDESAFHTGKLLFEAEAINFSFGATTLWPHASSLSIHSGDRLAIKGRNGSGKTTLINAILGRILPESGRVKRHAFRFVYIDQEYALIHNELNVYDQLQRYNDSALTESELKNKLTHFLFGKDSWDKSCAVLSGGERMRLVLCCLSLSRQAPDLIVLDEPTNNLDIQNVAILTHAIRDYKGTIVVVSHDEDFLEAVHIRQEFELS
ncbi:MAG: ABC-F family ATP-binding cassette domain-containing protein [Sphingobacteriales bacterium]|nr:MAG: ABC-F family ATP-binding cassette domain-containing protein [Sphingobacteriales bacterium]